MIHHLTDQFDELVNLQIRNAQLLLRAVEEIRNAFSAFFLERLAHWCAIKFNGSGPRIGLHGRVRSGRTRPQIIQRKLTEVHDNLSMAEKRRPRNVRCQTKVRSAYTGSSPHRHQNGRTIRSVDLQNLRWPRRRLHTFCTLMAKVARRRAPDIDVLRGTSADMFLLSFLFKHRSIHN